MATHPGGSEAKTRTTPADDAGAGTKLRAWIAALVTFVLLTTACLWELYPPLQSEQELQIEFGPLRTGHGEPLVVTGEFGRADFFMVRPTSERTVVFGFDHWGGGGPESRPITVEPGRRYRLHLTLPSFQSIAGTPFQPPNRLRVALDDQVLIDQDVSIYPRRATWLWFGRNPAGGSSCGPELTSARLFTADGRPLLGGIRETMTRGDRVRGWLAFGIWQAVFCVVLAGGVGYAFSGSPARGLRALAALRTMSAAGVREHRLAAILIAALTLLFTWLLTYGTFKVVYQDSFGDFYDYQAASLLAGRLDVPEPAISGESFMYGGKHYGYFGPTPALLRIPLVIFKVWFGQVTRLSMVIAFAGALIGTYLFLLAAARQLRPAAPRVGNWLIIAVLANAALGSTLLFLGGRAYVYHEAILWGITFAMWGCWCGMRWVAAPGSRWWLGALACGVLSVHARPPAGLFGLTFIGGCALLVAFYERKRLWLAAGVAVSTVLGVLSFNGLSYAKFRTIDGCPLRLNVQYNAQRLARIDGKQFHLSNLPFNTYTYLLEPNIVVRPKFPWLYIGDTKPLPRFPKSKIDLPDRTLALPYSMTGLCVLGFVGWVLVRRQRDAALLVTMTWAAAIPMTLAMFAAIATSQRYTGDFVPFLLCAAALGAVACDTLNRRVRIALGAILAVTSVWAFAMSAAATLHFQGAGVWGAPAGMEERYKRWQAAVDATFSSDPSR